MCSCCTRNTCVSPPFRCMVRPPADCPFRAPWRRPHLAPCSSAGRPGPSRRLQAPFLHPQPARTWPEDRASRHEHAQAWPALQHVSTRCSSQRSSNQYGACPSAKGSAACGHGASAPYYNKCCAAAPSPAGLFSLEGAPASSSDRSESGSGDLAASAASWLALSASMGVLAACRTRREGRVGCGKAKGGDAS